jgi:hypothetical protein
MTVTPERKREIAAAIGLAPEWAEEIRGGNDQQALDHALAIADRVEAERPGSGYGSLQAALRAMNRRQAALRARFGVGE